MDTWEYAATGPAGYVAFGSGCAGSRGTPLLAAGPGQLPWSAGTFRLELSSLPPGRSTLVWLGTSKTRFGFLKLPLDLGPVGLPGCALHVSADLTFPVLNWNGTAALRLDVPDDASLLGASFFNQALAADPGANAFGAVVSNAGEGRIGGK